MPELTCLKALQRISVCGCTNLSTIHNKLTDFEALVALDLYKSGIGLAIKTNTDSNLIEQVRVLKQRSGFQYVSHTGDAGDYDSDCRDDQEWSRC
jgi:hypothetical protein